MDCSFDPVIFYKLTHKPPRGRNEETAFSFLNDGIFFIAYSAYSQNDTPCNDSMKKTLFLYKLKTNADLILKILAERYHQLMNEDKRRKYK